MSPLNSGVELFEVNAAHQFRQMRRTLEWSLLVSSRRSLSGLVEVTSGLVEVTKWTRGGH